MFSKKPFGVEEPVAMNDLLQIYHHDGYLFIHSDGKSAEKSGALIIYDLFGRELYRQYISSGAEVIVPISFVHRFIMAKVQKNNSQKVEKISLF